MLARVIAIAMASVIALLAGAFAERRWRRAAKDLSGRLLTGIVYLVMPVVVFFTVVSLKWSAGVGAGLVYGWTERLCVLGLSWLIARKLLGLSRPASGALMACVVIANTGYLGIPLTALVLGSEQISVAVVYENLVNVPFVLLVGFAVGAAYGTKAGDRPAARVKSFFTRNPPLYALLLALVVPHGISPAWGTSLAHGLALGIAPIGFFALGVNLMLEHEEDGVRLFPPPFTKPVAAAIVLRLIVAPAVMVGLSRFVSKAPDAFLLEAAMPAGINALVVSHLYGLDMKITVGAITWTTGMVVSAAAVVLGLGGF